MPDLEGMVDFGSNSFWSLLLAVAIIGISFLVARWVRRLLRRRLRQFEGVDEYAGAILGRFAGWGVVLIGIILALTVLGVDMTAVALIIALIVVLVALASRSLVENWSAGLLLQLRTPFHLGDRIETQDYVGYVEEINVRSVVMRTGDGQVVHVPNKDVLENVIVNRTGHEGRRRSSIVVGVGYEIDLDSAESVLIEAAASVSGVYSDPAPSAWVSALGDAGVSLELRFWHDHSARHQVRSAVAHSALARMADADVEPFPPDPVVLSGSVETSTAA